MSPSIKSYNLILYLLLFLPISLSAQKGSIEIGLSPIIIQPPQFGAGIGLEYFHKPNSSIGFLLSGEFHEEESLFITKSYKNYKLTVRLKNHFQIVQSSAIKHYFGVFGDVAYAKATNTTIVHEREENGIDFSIGFTAGLLKWYLKKLSFKIDYSAGYRFNEHADLLGINFKIKKGIYNRFSLSINYKIK